MSEADEVGAELVLHGFAREFIDAAPDAMIAIDERGQITVANRQAEQLFGWPRSALIGRSLDMLIPHAQRGAHAAHVKTYTQQPRARPMGPSDLRGLRRDGTEIPIDVQLSPVVGPSGRWVIASIRDATERRRLEHEHLALERMATIGMVAASLGHEINNPLTAIILNLELTFERMNVADPLNETLREIHEAAQQIQRIVRDVGVLSRSPGGKRAACPRRVLASVLRIAGYQFEEHVRLVEHHEADVLVAIDESQLGQVLLNLVINAWQARVPDNTHDHEIRLMTRVVANDFVEIEVSDNGIGMSAETRANLFKPFFTTKPPGKGVGLGLAISRRLVTSAGGTLEVESSLGGGSTFRMLLPQVTASRPQVNDRLTSANCR